MTEVDPIDVAVAIEDGVEKLKKTGWTQGFTGFAEGPNCALGSLWYAEGELGSIYISPAVVKAGQALDDKAKELGYGNTALRATAMFNDEPGRTEEEVIDFMIGVAKDLRNG